MITVASLDRRLDSEKAADIKAGELVSATPPSPGLHFLIVP